MADLNIYNPAFTREMPARNRACLYGAMPVSTPQGRALFNYLILSPGHTAGSEEVKAEQMADLMQNLLFGQNLEHLLLPKTKRFMLRAVPTEDWIRFRNHINEKYLIIRLPDGYTPTPDEERIMLGLRRAGAQFAMVLGDMGSVPQNHELLECIDYVFIDHKHQHGLLTAYEGLKQKLPRLKNIGFKEDGVDFSIDEAAQYDCVCGMVRQRFIEYGSERPKWQHELMRTLAEEFSGIYDLREVIKRAARYPEMAQALRSMFNSKRLIALTVKRNSSFSSTVALRYSKTDLVNILCISTAYGLMCETQKRFDGNADGKYVQDPLSSSFGYFRSALIAGRVISRLAGQVCDDYETNHAFIVGFLMYLPMMIRDHKEKVRGEFMLSAVSEFYNGGGTLSLLLKGYHAVIHRNFEQLADLAARIGIAFPKEQYYRDYYEAMIWAEEVIRVIAGEQS